MGTSLSCIGRVPSLERIDCDLTPVRNKNLPIIWITGQQNTGKKTHGNFIKEKYSFEILNTTELLRTEATKDTQRGSIVKEALTTNKKVDDHIVIDLLKEALLESKTDKGFIISNFPKNSKQAELFVKEIGNVSFIYYLYTDTQLLIARAQQRSVGELDEDALRRNFASCTRDIKAGLGKFILKIESINTSGQPEEVFTKVENALVRRMNINRPIVTETDYVRPREQQQSEEELERELEEITHEAEHEHLDHPEEKQEKVDETSMNSDSDSF